MRIGVIRFTESPSVTIFIENQLLFSERLEYSDDLMQVLFDKLNGYSLDELKVIYKSTITNSVPKNGVKLSSFKIGNIIKYSCIAEEDVININSLAQLLGILTVHGYDYLSYYKSKSMNRDVLVVDRDMNGQYICAYCSNGTIKDYRITRYRNLENTLTNMISTYKTTDVMHIANTYDILSLNGYLKNKVTEHSEKCFVDASTFVLMEEPVKVLSSINGTVAHGFPSSEVSSDDSVGENSGSSFKSLHSVVSEEDDTEDYDDTQEEEIKPTKKVGAFASKKTSKPKGAKPNQKPIKEKKEKPVKVKKVVEDREGTQDYGKSSSDVGNFIMQSSHSTDSKKNKFISGLLNFLVSTLLLAMVIGVVATTIYKDRFNSMSEELSQIERDIAELEPTNQSLQNIVDGKDNLEAIEAISAISSEGIVEEIRYSKKNLEVTVAFKSTESLETYKGFLQSVIGVLETASAGTVNYEGQKYERFIFKCPPYLGMVSP